MFFRVEATHSHHLTNVFPTTREKGRSDILYIFPNKLKKTAFSLSMRKGILVPLRSVWQSNSSWLFCIFPYFAKNCQRLNFPYQPFSKIPILPKIATSSISPINHLKNSHPVYSFLLYHNCAHRTWITLHNHVEQKLSNRCINTKIEQIYFLFRKRFKFL